MNLDDHIRELWPAEVRAIEAAREFWRDGYCDCRCGQTHHRLKRADKWDNGRVIKVFCRYHKRVCGEISLAGIEDTQNLYTTARSIECMNWLGEYR